MLLQIANKPGDEKATYTVGADVSRFQRASVPGKASSESSSAVKEMGQAFSSFAGALTGRPPQPQPQPQQPQVTAPKGQFVNVARGNNVTVVPVGAK
jgi:pilus assembly protein CpaB